MAHLASPRLHYERLSSGGAETLWRLAVDDHVRRYLLDGELMTREWAGEEVQRADALYDATGLALWLVRESPDDDAVGFVGFRVFPEVSEEPQLLYAFVEQVTGNGYATEAGRALLDYAFGIGMDEVESAVDAPNVASLRVLQKIGFRETHRVPGAFGDTIVLRCRA